MLPASRTEYRLTLRGMVFVVALRSMASAAYTGSVKSRRAAFAYSLFDGEPYQLRAILGCMRHVPDTRCAHPTRAYSKANNERRVRNGGYNFVRGLGDIGKGLDMREQPLNTAESDRDDGVRAFQLQVAVRGISWAS